MTDKTTVVIRRAGGNPVRRGFSVPIAVSGILDRPPSRTMTPHAQSYLSPYIGGGACTVGAAAANSSSLRPDSGGYIRLRLMVCLVALAA